jgi:hypothetical protein
MSEKSEVCFKCGEPGASVKLTQKGTGQVVYIHKRLPYGAGCDVYSVPSLNQDKK